MTLTTIASHTIDLDRLHTCPDVLDAGCRDFDFTYQLLHYRPEARIVAMDPAPDIVSPEGGRFAYLKMALVGDERGGYGFAHYSTGHGDCLTDQPYPSDAVISRVPCIGIERLSAARRVKHWDVVKLDVEGSEFQILEHWPGPIAKQISVEFHDYQRLEKYNDAYYERLFARLATFGYRVVQHELSDISGRGAIGHWNSLILLEV